MKERRGCVAEEVIAELDAEITSESNMQEKRYLKCERAGAKKMHTMMHKRIQLLIAELEQAASEAELTIGPREMLDRVQTELVGVRPNK